MARGAWHRKNIISNGIWHRRKWRENMTKASAANNARRKTAASAIKAAKDQHQRHENGVASIGSVKAQK